MAAVDELLKKKAPAAKRNQSIDVNQLLAQPEADAASGMPQVDPTAAVAIQAFSPKGRTSSQQAEDALRTDQLEAQRFGARVGGFAPTRPDYKDDPSLPMADRMSAFNNRTTRAGLQEIGQPQVDARAKAGLETRLGVPDVPFDVNRMVDSGMATNSAGAKNHPYDTRGLPTGQQVANPGLVSAEYPGVMPPASAIPERMPQFDAMGKSTNFPSNQQLGDVGLLVGGGARPEAPPPAPFGPPAPAVTPPPTPVPTTGLPTGPGNSRNTHPYLQGFQGGTPGYPDLFAWLAALTGQSRPEASLNLNPPVGAIGF